MATYMVPVRFLHLTSSMILLEKEAGDNNTLVPYYYNTTFKFVTLENNK